MIRYLGLAIAVGIVLTAAVEAQAQRTCSKIKANCPKNCRASVEHPAAAAKCPGVCQANWEKCMQTGQWCNQGKCKAAAKQ